MCEFRCRYFFESGQWVVPISDYWLHTELRHPLDASQRCRVRENVLARRSLCLSYLRSVNAMKCLRRPRDVVLLVRSS